MKFLQGKYALMEEIEKMFHQVFVSPNDLNALRFLWRESPDEVASDRKMLVHIFGKVDSPCCANCGLTKVPEMVDKSFKKVMTNNFYMDGFLSSLLNKESLVGLYFSLISCLKTFCFKLTKFVSNSKVILDNFASSELSTKFINLDLNSQPIERVLGIIWNANEDFFIFKPLLKQCVYTKRGALGIVASIFDPLGISTPLIAEAKLIIQSLWAENVDWDDQIPDYLEKRWSN